MEPVYIIADELLVQNALMGLAGIVSAGLFWLGVYLNI
jgi:hypothetical protein